MADTTSDVIPTHRVIPAQAGIHVRGSHAIQR
jgi:hypothetical protein